MRLAVKLTLTLVAFALCSFGMQAGAEAAEKRIGLVIGNAAYAAQPLATPANDAGLIAQTLQAAGFDVVGARDLDEDGLRKALRDFLDKAAASGPDTVAFVYLAGYGLQLEGENYFAPIDLRVSTAADVGLRALRVSDYTKALAALKLKARFFVLDGARRSPFTVPDKPLAGGLALAEAEPGSLLAFNAAPGTVGPDEKGPYGSYAQALVEMIREGGLQPGPLFDRVRLRVDTATKGAALPWDSDRLGTNFLFFERSASAPTAGDPKEVGALRERPLRDLGARDAYALCVERDDLAHYQQFVTDYPGEALARRVRALIAARREALVWRRTWMVGTPDAYWSYLQRYPRGPHAWDARRRLTSLAAAFDPPPHFAAIVYDVPPPPPEEIVFVDRPVLYLDDPVYALPPPPPPAYIFLPPPPAYLYTLPPPPPVVGLYILPSPPIVAVPTYVSAPAYIAAPPNNILFQNIHNTTVIQQLNRQNAAPTAFPGGNAAPVATGVAMGAAAAHVALPASIGQRAAIAGPAQANRAANMQPPMQPSPSRALPAANGQVLPGRPAAESAVRQGLAPATGMPSNAGSRALRTPPAATGREVRRADAAARRAMAFRPPQHMEPGNRQAPLARQQAQVARRQAIIGRQQAAQAMQQRQAMQAQRAQQMMMQRQQQMVQHQQHAPAFAPRPMMAPPRGPAPGPRQSPAMTPHGGGHGPCHPGAPCR